MRVNTSSPAEDEEILKFGVGKSQKNSPNIERLLEFQISDTLIYRTGTPPIQIKLSSNGKGRNWEGVAKLENLNPRSISNLSMA